MITHAIGGVIRPRVAVVRPVAADTRLDEALVLRRCAMYRKAFRGTAISYPADALRFEAVAVWTREHGVTVDVTSTDDLDRWTRGNRRVTCRNALSRDGSGRYWSCGLFAVRGG